MAEETQIFHLDSQVPVFSNLGNIKRPSSLSSATFLLKNMSRIRVSSSFKRKMLRKKSLKILKMMSSMTKMTTKRRMKMTQWSMNPLPRRGQGGANTESTLLSSKRRLSCLLKSSTTSTMLPGWSMCLPRTSSGGWSLVPTGKREEEKPRTRIWKKSFSSGSRPTTTRTVYSPPART